MKLKSKLVLAASSLLILSGVAAGTGTYAWFTATQSATVGVNQINVNTDTRGLTMTATATDASHVVTDAAASTANNPVFTATAVNTEGKLDNGNCLTDVSGNGKSFFKATMSDSTITGATAISSLAVPYVYEISLTFTSVSSTPMAIFLSSANSSINNNATIPSGDKDLAGAARVAIVSNAANVAGETVLAYYAPHDTIDDSYTYFNGTGSTSTEKVSTIVAANNLLDASKVSIADSNDATTGVTASLNGYVGEANANPLNVKARIWIEGQDSDCDNAALAQTFSTMLKFYGISTIKTA